MRTHELQHIGIACEDHHFTALLHGLLCQGPQQVVSLIAVHPHDWHGQRLQQLEDLGELTPQPVRHGQARGLVVTVLRVSERGR